MLRRRSSEVNRNRGRERECGDRLCVRELKELQGCAATETESKHWESEKIKRQEKKRRRRTEEAGRQAGGMLDTKGPKNGKCKKCQSLELGTCQGLSGRKKWTMSGSNLALPRCMRALALVR